MDGTSVLILGKNRSTVSTAGDAPTQRLIVWVSGDVQGVGFRWWTRCRALELSLTGSATNLPDGRVEVLAQGAVAGCQGLLKLLCEQPASQPPRGAAASWRIRPGRVDSTTHSWGPADGQFSGFVEA